MIELKKSSDHMLGEASTLYTLTIDFIDIKLSLEELNHLYFQLFIELQESSGFYGSYINQLERRYIYE